MRRIFVLFLSTAVLVTCSIAQEALPQFSLSVKPNGKVIIGWHNSFPSVIQISIQRSSDSLKNFTTILTVPDPAIPENGFVDGKAPRLNMFYRLFIVLEDGNYMFSQAKRSFPDSGSLLAFKTAEVSEEKVSKTEGKRVTYVQPAIPQKKAAIPPPVREAPKPVVEKIIFIKQKDSVIGRVSSRVIERFRDSVLKRTKDTLVFIGTDTILVNAFVPKEVYRISGYVYTSKDGNVSVSLPDAGLKKYSVKFLEQDLTMIFELKDIRDAFVLVDKSNFVHSGWFRFELYEDGKLKEKNKFFIPKEF